VSIRFLADANLDQDIVAGLLRREPAIDFVLPQGLIPPGMADPEVLELAASLGRILVTHDVRTMSAPLRGSSTLVHALGSCWFRKNCRSAGPLKTCCSSGSSQTRMNG